MMESSRKVAPKGHDEDRARLGARIGFTELNNDPTNWWAPDVSRLLQTIRASGFPRAQAKVAPGPHSLYVLVEGAGGWQVGVVAVNVGVPAAPAGDRAASDESAALRQALADRDAEIAYLRALVAGYERGRFIRCVKQIQGLRSGSGRERSKPQ